MARTRAHLGRALLVLGTAFAVLGLGVVSVWTQVAAGDAVQRVQRDDRDALQRSLSGLTEQYFNATFLATQTAATTTPWTLSARDVPTLRRVASTSPLTSYGAALVSLTGRPIAASTTALPAATDPGFGPLRAQLLQGRAGLSDVMRVGRHDVVAFAVPVLRDGVPAAVLLTFADIRDWALQGYDQQLTVGKQAVPYVLDSRGVVAASGDPAMLGRHLGLAPPAHTTSTTWGDRAVVVSAGGTDRGWHAMTVQPAETWSAGVTASRHRALAALAALLTLVVALLVWFYHRQQTVQRRLAEERLHDPLTGLGQRRMFALKLDAALARQRRTPAPVALLYCDLDQFKAINDRHGHNVGDVVLRTVAERLVGAVREEDLVVRFGGDEFGVVVEGVQPDELRVLVGRIYAAVESPLEIGPLTLTPQVSIGGAVARAAGDADALVHAADLAMYEVKALPDRRATVLTDLSAGIPTPRGATALTR